MFRFLLTVLAVLFVVRLLSQFVHAVIVGMRGESPSGHRGAAAGGKRRPGVRETRAHGGASPPPRHAVDRAQAIDVEYTEVEAERAAAAGDGAKKG